METDIRYNEPSSPAFERETAASAEQWANWTTNQIRSAIEAERERTFALLTELLVAIQKDMIPEVVATLPALRGPAGPVGPAGKLPIVKEWTREKVYYEGYVVTYDGGSLSSASRHRRAARQRSALAMSRSSWSRRQVDPPPWHV